MRDDDGIDKALDIGKNGAGAEGPKVIARIVIELIEVAPGQTQTTMQCAVPDELLARGLYQKGAVLLEMTLAQRNAAQQPRVVSGAGMTPPELIKRMRRHSGS